MAAMSVDTVPIWVFFVGTILVVMASIEAGYRLGRHRRSEDEKEAPISGVSGAILGLTAFILAFTFGIVAERYDARKALVRDDANAIRTTCLPASLDRPGGYIRVTQQPLVDLQSFIAAGG